MLPPRPHRKLVGRESVLVDLKKRLFDHESIALNGLPGVGKTALAIELANDPEVLEYFQNNVYWISLGPAPDVFSLLGDLSEAVNIPLGIISDMATIPARMKAINTAIGHRPILFVIDDAWNIDESLDFKLGNAKCSHLLTTNNLQVALSFASISNETVKELTLTQNLLLFNHFFP